MNKKFYYLDKEENGELTLSIFPYLEDDYDMAKIIFTDSMLIDGWNVMEPYEWKIERVSQQDSLFNLSLTNDGLSRNSRNF